MTAHTAGPWTTDEKEHDQPYLPIEIRSARHRTICTVWVDDAPVPDFNAEQRANARLLTAAPDLLGALEEIVDLWDAMLAGEYRPDSFTTQPARAAIAKAKGVQ